MTSDPNPYQAPMPAPDESNAAARPAPQSFGQALIHGARLGARLGAISAGLLAIIGLAIMVVFFLMNEHRPQISWELAFDVLVHGVGGLLACVALCAMYGAFFGAVLMGIASLFRRRQD